MKNFREFFTFCCFILLNNRVSAITEHYVSKGDFPYMAFIYYPDESVRDVNGNRFFQNAILIKPNWLVSAAVEVGNGSYPEKTLIARLGAISVDANLTFNEDEDEQEGEVIQVVRPIKYNQSPVWSVDISLLKTLLPFNITSAVKFIELNVMYKNTQTICKILAFTRNSGTQNKVLSQVTIELLPQNVVECGTNFIEDRMICGIEENEFTNLTSNNEFCQDNSGGPLICEDEIIGIQNYVKDQTCKKPRLYQLISGWRKFILCGTVYNCHEGDDCSSTCHAFPKDQAPDESTTVSTATVFVEKVTSLIESLEIAPTQSTIEPAAVSIEPAAGTLEPAAVSKEPAAISKEPVAVSIEPAAVSKEPAAVSIEPASVSKEPAAVSKEPAAVSIEPAADSKEPAAVSIEPAAVSKEPAAVSMETEAVTLEPVTAPVTTPISASTILSSNSTEASPTSTSITKDVSNKNIDVKIKTTEQAFIRPIHSKARDSNVTIEDDEEITDKTVFRGAKIEAQLEDRKARRSSATGVYPMSHIAVYSFIIKYLY